MRGVLIDENLPGKIGEILSPLGLSTQHVSQLGLTANSDRLILRHAVANNLAVLSKDSDYLDLLALEESGRVVILAVGNMRLRDLFKFVEENAETIARFVTSEAHRALVLGREGEEL